MITLHITNCCNRMESTKTMRVHRKSSTIMDNRCAICMYNLYIYIQPKNYGSWNTNIIIDIYIYPVMYIPPHSTRSGTNPISTSLPKNKHSPTSQSLVRQHHETRCPPLFRPSFKLKSLENSGRRMLGRRWVVDSSTAMIIVDTLKGYLKSS